MVYLIETIIEGAYDTECKAYLKALQLVACGRHPQNLWAIRTWPTDCGKWKLAFYNVPSTSPAEHLAAFKALHESGELDRGINDDQSWCVAVGETVTRYKDMAQMKVLKLCENLTKPVHLPLYTPLVYTS